MSNSAIFACEKSGLQSEVHVLYGNITRINENLSSVLKTNRRVFYITTSGDAPTKVFEFEHDPELGLYCIRHAQELSDSSLGVHCINHAEIDAKTVNGLHLELDNVILQTRGKSCMGQAFKDTRIYKSVQFSRVAEKNLDDDIFLSELILPKGSNDGYYKVTLSMLC